MLSIIIVTYNAQKFIRPCLDSVFSQEYKDFDVFAVDNNSGDKTVEVIQNNYRAVKLIRNNENKGACYARNQGIKMARSKYILTLDCDVILEKNFLLQVVAIFENTEEKVGMAQPKILKNDKSTVFSTGIYLSPIRRFYDVGNGQIDKGQFSRQKYIFGPCCAAALYKKEMLDGISANGEYFDERLFFLVEDVDLAWRAQKKGWKALYCPEAVCYHTGNSCGFTKDFRQYLAFRNRYLMMLKNDGILGIVIRMPFLIFYDIPRILYLLFTNKYTLGPIC